MSNKQIERFSDALARLSGDEELLLTLASMVVDDARDTIASLQSELKRDEMPEAAMQAHKLKGMCSTFETGSPVVELEEVIHAARAGNADEACDAFRRCKPELETLISDIEKLSG